MTNPSIASDLIERLAGPLPVITAAPGNVPDLARINAERLESHGALSQLTREVDELREALDKAARFTDAMMSFYGQGLEVTNWHLNGETEPLDNFIDENSDPDLMTVIREVLSRSSGRVSDATE